MKVEFVKQSKAFTHQFCIFVSKFTPEEKEEIIKIIKPLNAGMIMSYDLIAITCNDEPTFNWLLVRWS